VPLSSTFRSVQFVRSSTLCYMSLTLAAAAEMQNGGATPPSATPPRARARSWKAFLDGQDCSQGGAYPLARVVAARRRSGVPEAPPLPGTRPWGHARRRAATRRASAQYSGCLASGRSARAVEASVPCARNAQRPFALAQEPAKKKAPPPPSSSDDSSSDESDSEPVVKARRGAWRCKGRAP